MSKDEGSERAGDLEPISRMLDGKGRPLDRIAIDKQGRKIWYKSDGKGRVEITHYEEVDN